EIGAFAGEGNHASVKAMEPTEILVVPCESLTRLMGEYKSFAQLVTKNLANRVVYLMSLVEDFTLRPVISRLARYLLENSVGGVVKRRSWSTQTELASRLGTVPDVLNRALRSLAGQNLIEIDRRVLKIVDHDGLLAKSQPTD
ncbi:MAG: Crp/Fnr family transcriptional regulator, partial [Spirochaetales bacterium]|nr:Crp/Fnr family transcriptional regulator [Spirochaetales bacterium]